MLLQELKVFIIVTHIRQSKTISSRNSRLIKRIKSSSRGLVVRPIVKLTQHIFQAMSNLMYSFLCFNIKVQQFPQGSALTLTWDILLRMIMRILSLLWLRLFLAAIPILLTGFAHHLPPNRPSSLDLSMLLILFSLIQLMKLEVSFSTSCFLSGSFKWFLLNLIYVPPLDKGNLI